MAKSINSLIEGIPNLASYSGVMREIEAILNDPQSTLADVGEAIEKDPGLTARLLKLGNSSFYGFPSRLETVAETIGLIGLQQVQDLILASTVIEIFDGVSADLVSMESFWKHSLACGVAARLLAMERRDPKPDKYFVAGLLHDIGRLVLFSRAADKAREIFQLCGAQSPMMLRDAEKQILGFDHAEIGASLLVVWSYPSHLVNAVQYHHQPLSAGVFQLEASIVHFADYLVNAMQLGCAGEKMVPPLNVRAWERMGLNLDALDSVTGDMEDQIEAVENAFLRK